MATTEERLAASYDAPARGGRDQTYPQPKAADVSPEEKLARAYADPDEPTEADEHGETDEPASDTAQPPAQLGAP